MDGHTAPATGAIQSRESSRTLGTEKEKGSNGNTAYFVPHKYYRKEVQISGVGDAELALVVAGKFDKNTVKVVRAKQNEFNGKLPKFERTAVGFFDVGFDEAA